MEQAGVNCFSLNGLEVLLNAESSLYLPLWNGHFQVNSG